MSETDFFYKAESGDLLLFETQNFAAAFQRKITGSRYGKKRNISSSRPRGHLP
jgi:hypothetical protein